jgi:hypothetical protein
MLPALWATPPAADEKRCQEPAPGHDLEDKHHEQEHQRKEPAQHDKHQGHFLHTGDQPEDEAENNTDSKAGLQCTAGQDTGW